MLSNKLKLLLGVVLVATILVLTQMPSASAKPSDSAPVNLVSLWTFGGDMLAFPDFQEASEKPPKDNLSQNFVFVTKTWDGGGVSRQQGSPAGAAVRVGTVADAEAAAGSLTAVMSQPPRVSSGMAMERFLNRTRLKTHD